MSLDIAVFKTRTLSALVFGAVMLTGLLGGKLPFILVFAIACFIAAKEFFALQERICKLAPDATTPTIYAASAVILYLYIAEAGGIYFIENIKQNRLAYAGTFLILYLMSMGMANNRNMAWRMLLGYLYISVSFGLLAQCYRIHQLLPLLLIVCIWVNDTMQYVVGSLIGKTKMVPLISPKKTWEGTLGGSILSVLTATGISVFYKELSAAQFACIACSAAVFGTLGDLIESMLKRKANVKDSGTIMPGHGGILDRFDSILLAAPILFIAWRVFAW